ncbi:MAG: FAD-dependent tricarballylate dehydrogenase TcuA, partial [Thermoplasmataceae archaeon]
MANKVVVIGGGNAGLCAAIEAAESGNQVLLIEASPLKFRGGNSKYTRDIRYVHGPDRFTSGEYSAPELMDDLRQVSGGELNHEMAELVISRSEAIPEWMALHGIVFKKEIRGTLSLSRTNAFFMGGGKALVDAYYKQLEKLGVHVIYDAEVASLRVRESFVESVLYRSGGSSSEVKGDRFIFASGGFEANREMITEFWGKAASNIKVRGSKFNRGLPLKALLGVGALSCGSDKSGHMVAVDARSPDFDGGIVTRIDAIPWGIVVNERGERFYDEGEDIWPKRYAVWGRLVADQPGQIAYAITDSKTIGKYMPTAYPPFKASNIGE